MTPAGERFTQRIAEELTVYQRLHPLRSYPIAVGMSPAPTPWIASAKA